MAPARAVASTTPAPVIDFVSPSPVILHIAPAPLMTHVTPSEQFSLAFPMTAVATGVCLDSTDGTSERVRDTAEVVQITLQDHLQPRNVQVIPQELFPEHFDEPAAHAAREQIAEQIVDSGSCDRRRRGRHAQRYSTVSSHG